MRKRELTIPTILGIITAIGGLVAGIILLNKPLRSLVGAAVEETPSQVKMTNITDSSFTVSWITPKSTSGYVQYGEKNNPELVVSDDRDQEKGQIGNYFTHFVTIRGLKATTKYSFRIGSGRNLYEVTTGVTLRNPPPADVAYGQVITASGDPVDGAIVYLGLGGMVPQAALTQASGSWVIPLSTARSSDLTNFAAYDKDGGRVEVFVQAGGLGTATVATTAGKTKPVAEIALGENRNETLETRKPEPTPASKFSTQALQAASGSAQILLISSPKFDERVNSQRPEIMGKGPAETQITITVESDNVYTGKVSTDQNGDWSYSVPGNLEPGEHTVTITSVVDGVKKTIKRNFVVEAAGVSNVPAKTATPSAKLKPSPTPVPRIAYPSTESGTPQSGNLTPTLILLILGAGLIVAGYTGYNYKS